MNCMNVFVVNFNLFDFNSGPRNQPSHTDEKTMSTTTFNGANVQDEKSAADLATQQSKSSIAGELLT